MNFKKLFIIGLISLSSVLTACGNNTDGNVSNETSLSLDETNITTSTYDNTEITTEENEVEGAVNPNVAVSENTTDNTGAEAAQTQNGGGGDTTTVQNNTTSTGFTANDLIFIYKGINITPNDNMADILDKIGQPKSYSSAPSCNYDGEDKIYEYEGFTIYTYPAGRTDKIFEIEITSAAVSTPRGIKVGMTLDQALDIYGGGFILDGLNYKYSVDGIKYFYMNIQNGKINHMGYVLAN